MAKGNDTVTGLTRRGFLAGCSVAAAAATLPTGAVAATTGSAGFAAGTWPEAVRSWPAAVEAMKAQTEAVVAQFRPAYLSEVERLAEELRPRFEAGDLRSALGDTDEDKEQEARDRIETLCVERFGLQVKQHGYEEPEGDDALGKMVCAVSPSAPLWEVDDGEWNHPCYAARACAGSDVLAIVRREGWGVRS